MDTSSSSSVRSCWHGCSCLKKNCCILQESKWIIALFRELSDQHLALWTKAKGNKTTCGRCWWHPPIPDFLIDFLQLGQTEIWKDFSLSLNIKSNKINVYCFFHEVRRVWLKWEGWGVLAGFSNRLSFPRQQRSLCSAGTKWENQEALGIIQLSGDKFSVFLPVKRNF